MFFYYIQDKLEQHIIVQRLMTEFELKQTEQGIQQLLLALKHTEGFVRLNASFALLNIFPNEAEDTLEKLSKEHGHLGFSAEITLEEWRKGTLNVQ